MKNLKTFEKFGQSKGHRGKFIHQLWDRNNKNPKIGYKEEDGKFYKQNPAGGQWIEITETEFKLRSK